MTLFANSNICVGSWSVFDCFFFSYGWFFFAFFAYLLILYWVSDFVNLPHWVLCIFILVQIFLNSGMHLTYLETDWSFQALPFRFVRQNQSNAQSGLIISHYRGKTLLHTLPSALWIMTFSGLAGGTSTTTGPVGVTGTILLSPFSCFFPWFRVMPHRHAMHWSVPLLNTWGRPSKLSEDLSRSGPLRYSVLCTLAT